MQTSTIAPLKNETKQKDFLPLSGTDYVEFYVGNAKQAAHDYKTAYVGVFNSQFFYTL